MKYPVIETGDVSSVARVIATGIRSAKTMREAVQKAAITLMAMAAWEGTDAESGKPYNIVACEMANNLVNERGNGTRGDGLVRYMVNKCGFKLQPGNVKAGFTNTANRDWIVANFEAAKEVMWHSYAPSKPFKGFDFEEELKKTLSRANNAKLVAESDKDKAKLVHVDEDMLAVLTALVMGQPVESEHALTLVDKLIPSGETSETNNDADAHVAANDLAEAA